MGSRPVVFPTRDLASSQFLLTKTGGVSTVRRSPFPAYPSTKSGSLFCRFAGLSPHNPTADRERTTVCSSCLKSSVEVVHTRIGTKIEM